MKLSSFLFLACMTFTGSSLARPIQVVNVISGVPQPADEGSDRSGGFGDVAANVNAARELKKLHPGWEVRLIVTSAAQRENPIIPTTNELIKIMIPDLDPSVKDTVQMNQGVEVIFLNADFGKVIHPSQKSNPKNMEDLYAEVKQAMPPSDVNLNFSHYRGGAPFLRINTRLAIGAEENFEYENPVNSSLQPEPGQPAPFVHLTSGPLSLGFSLLHGARDPLANHRLIRDWAQKQNVALPAQFKIAFSYTAEWQATHIYAEAIGKIAADVLPPDVPVYLFVKNFPELESVHLSKKVHLIRFGGMSDALMTALIDESFVAPQVTGDISLGKGLSLIRPDRTLVYESLPWKNQMTAGMKALLEKDSGLALDDIFLFTSHLQILKPDDLHAASQKLAARLISPSFQSKLYQSLSRQIKGWDLLNNSLIVADGLLGNDISGQPQSVQNVVSSIHTQFLLDSTEIPRRKISELMTLEEFKSLLIYNAGRIPDLAGVWSKLPAAEAEQIYLYGGTLRGFLRWHTLMLQTHTPAELRQVPMPPVNAFQLMGGKDVDFIGPGASEERVTALLTEQKVPHIDYFKRERYEQFVKFGGPTLEKSAINFRSILDPLDGIQHYYEGRLVFYRTNYQLYSRDGKEDSDFSKTGEALRFIRFAHFNLPELTPDQQSVKIIQKLPSAELGTFNNEGRLVWLEISLGKLLTAARGSLPEVLDLLKKYQLLELLVDAKVSIDPSHHGIAKKWLQENAPHLCERLFGGQQISVEAQALAD